MFGKIGLQELILILVIALIIFGPRKLPEIGRSIGKGIREFRQATTEMSRNVSLDDGEDEEENAGSKGDKLEKESANSKKEPVAADKDAAATPKEQSGKDSQAEGGEAILAVPDNGNKH